MFIRLTRLDNSPIWINAAFVVTVEPRKGGGSVVVPIGDGLDYDVRETTDQVLAMLGDTPTATVVPVPAPKMLAPTPADVSPEPETTRDEPPVAPSDEMPKPAKRTRRTKKSSETSEGEAEAQPVRKTRSRTKKAEVETTPPAVVEEKSVEIPAVLVDRLRKMMPGSMRKLVNTLQTQFKVADADAVVAELQAKGVIDIEREHVIWK